MIYCENIVNVTLFFLNSSPDFDNNFFLKKKFHLFWQWHCHNSIPLFPFPFSTMALPQLPKKKKKNFTYFGNTIATITNFFFFFYLFRQYHCHNSFFFFPHIFGKDIATITKKTNFIYFGNTIATILFLFFFLTFSAMALPK